MELRHDTRIDAPLGIGCHGSAGWSAGRVRDISANGAYIALAGGPFRAQTSVTLALDLYASGNRVRVRWPATIVRADRDGIAVVYGERTKAAADSLSWIINQFQP